MRIGIDATALSGSIVGHSSYVSNLIREMLHCGDRDRYEWIIYTRGNTKLPNLDLSDRVKIKSCPFKSRKICEQLWLSKHTPFDNLDIFHSTWSLPIIPPSKPVLTLHGMASILYPKLFPKSYRLYMRQALKRNMNKPVRYIAISQATKNDFVKYFGLSESLVDVVHHGVNQDIYYPIKDGSAIQRLREKYSLPQKFILFVGAIIPIKNIGSLVKAYSLLAKKKTFQDIGLVIAGSNGWGYKPVFDTADKLGLKKKIIFTGFFPQEDLPSLYSAAELFVMPSIYEGFGIPVVEAFACGTPVITSNTSCLPEIAGDAGLTADPHNIEDLADKIETVITDVSLRQKMISNGLNRAKHFSWERAAKKSLQTYEKALMESKK